MSIDRDTDLDQAVISDHLGFNIEIREAFPRGFDNVNRLILASDGRKLILRVYCVGTQEQIEFELKLVSDIALKGFPTPRPLMGQSGLWFELHGHKAAIFEFVPQEHVDKLTIDQLRQVGKAAASLHCIGSLIRPPNSILTKYRRIEDRCFIAKLPVTELQDLIEQVSVFVNTTASLADKFS